MKKKHDTTFIIDELPAGAGEPVFSYGGKVKSAVQGSRLKNVYKTAFVAYFLAVLCFLVFWFIYTFVVALYHDSALTVIRRLAPDFFALAVCAALIIFICSGAIPKIFRKILKRRQVPAYGEEQTPAEAALVIEDGFELYENFLVFYKNGERIVVDRNKVVKFTVTRIGSGCSFSVTSRWFDSVSVRFSASKINKLKRALGGNLSVEKVPKPRYSPPAGGRQKRRRRKIEISEEKIGGFFAGFVCVAVGGGLIAMHYCVSESIPVFLAAFFIAGGVIFFLSMFGDKEIVVQFFVPLMFGGVFTSFPSLICKTVAESNSIALKWSSVHHFLSSFSGVFAAVGFLTAVGGLLILIAVINLIKIIKERN